MERLSLYATASRGTEDTLARELSQLGIRKVRQDRGGVRFSANLSEALYVCLWSRVAMRVLYPLAERDVTGAEGLYEAARELPWEELLTPNTTFAVEAVLRDSEHAHSGFVALKVKDALVDRLRDKLGRRPDVDTRKPDVRVVAHLAKRKLSLSLDVCGEPLHKRGYRVEPTPAPLKETLGAAMLLEAGYTGDEPLVDPMCGSGTLLIEGALIAMNRAPNAHRRFSVEKWANFGETARRLLVELKGDARMREKRPEFPIFGFDKSEDALAAARRNARAAQVGDFVKLSVGDATALNPPAERGLVASNPPYGERIGKAGQKWMKTFYFKLGENFARWRNWRLALLAGNPAFESAFHARPFSRKTLFNGPIECRLLQYRRAEATARPDAT